MRLLKSLPDARASDVDAIIRLQADHHDLVPTSGFANAEDFCVQLMHERAYREAAELLSDRVVLDLGCNTGWGSALIAERATRVVGVDVSSAAIAVANRTGVRPNASFVLVDGRRLPFADRSFAGLVSFQVIEHIADCHEYLSEVRRVLASDALALFSTPNRAIRLDEGMPPWNPFHVQEFTAESFAGLLGRYFDNVRVLGMFGAGPIYQRELRRVQRQRRSWRRALRAETSMTARGVATVASFVGRIGAGARSRMGLGGSKDFAAQYRVEQLRYADRHLARALDLLAICRVSA
jgi:SAM-dependent methyltransferase